MHINDLDQVGYLNNDRLVLLEKLREIKGSLGITIGGRYQNEDIVDEIRPHVQAALQSRLDVILLRIKSYGVNFDEVEK